MYRPTAKTSPAVLIDLPQKSICHQLPGRRAVNLLLLCLHHSVLLAIRCTLPYLLADNDGRGRLITNLIVS